MSFQPASLHPFIEPEVPGCPIGQMNLAIRRVASEFCARTKCWRERVLVTVTDTSFTAYQPTLPAHAKVHVIEGAWFDGAELEPVAFNDLSPQELAAVTGRPRVITQRTDGQIRVAPRATGSLVLNLILKPPAAGPAAYTLPDMLLEEHADAIASGALERLLGMSGKPWSDLGAASIHAGRYERAVAKATARNQRGQQQTPRRTRAHFI